jgi:hypothetical protein
MTRVASMTAMRPASSGPRNVTAPGTATFGRAERKDEVVVWQHLTAAGDRRSRVELHGGEDVRLEGDAAILCDRRKLAAQRRAEAEWLAHRQRPVDELPSGREQRHLRAVAAKAGRHMAASRAPTPPPAITTRDLGACMVGPAR